MSAAEGTMMRMTGDVVWPNGWRVEYRPLPGDLRGLTYYRQRCSIIDPGLHPWMHKCVVVHESIHAHDGPVPGWMEAREERRVNRETARRLIPLDALIEAMQTTTDARVAAAWLEVPVAMIWSRLKGAHPSERAAIRRALTNQEEGTAP